MKGFTMVFDTVMERPRSGNLVGHAVHRNQLLSLDGVLERIFSLAFSGLVYPQIWEDPVVDMAAMEIKPHHHVMTIASGGCNVLSYLTASPARITAVDLNSTHVALTRLKLAGLAAFPGWAELYRFFGEADDSKNIRNYRRYLLPMIDGETRKYWEGRSWLGRKRVKYFQNNIYRKGLLGIFIGVSHGLASIIKCRKGPKHTRPSLSNRIFNRMIEFDRFAYDRKRSI